MSVTIGVVKKPESQLEVTKVINTEGLNGTIPYKLISEKTINENIVKASGGNLYSIIAIGLTNEVRFLKFFNKNTLPSWGEDLPIMTIPIPANTQGAGLAISFPDGINFDRGIVIGITAGSADNNEDPIEAGDVIVNLTYA